MTQILNVLINHTFKIYISSLKDHVARGQIAARLKRLAKGQWGDAAPIGDGLSELRIHTGPGYRVYCKQIGGDVIIFGAGTKDSQQKDIESAKADAREI